jgi:hypothetical protein
MKNDNGSDGLQSIQNLMYSVDPDSLNPNDNIYVVQNPRIMVVNVTNFTTLVHSDEDDFHKYDLREPVRNVMFPNQHTQYIDNTVITTDDWKDIPQYSRTEERRQSSDSSAQLNQYIQQVRLQNTPQKQFIRNPNVNTQSARYIFSQENSNNYPKPRSVASVNIKWGGMRK